MSIGYADRDHSHADEQLPQFTMIDHKPTDLDPSVRGSSSSSSHTKAEASHSVPVRPPSVHLREAACYDSVDEIFSLYDQNHSQHQNQNTGVIWVKSEVQVSRDGANWPFKN
jgi:hypothetical protein